MCNAFVLAVLPQPAWAIAKIAMARKSQLRRSPMFRSRDILVLRSAGVRFKAVEQRLCSGKRGERQLILKTGGDPCESGTGVPRPWAHSQDARATTFVTTD